MIRAANYYEPEILVGEPVTRLQSRDYLDGARRECNTGGGISLFSVRGNNGGLDWIAENAYPYGEQLISDDGSILVLTDDGESEDVTATRIEYMTGGTLTGY